jgi:hypothetical protein
MSQQISLSRLRFLRLEGDVETKLRFLDCRDKLFEIVKIFSTVETYSLRVLRSRVSIETMSRQIETPRLTFLLTATTWGCCLAFFIAIGPLHTAMPGPRSNSKYQQLFDMVVFYKINKY